RRDAHVGLPAGLRGSQGQGRRVPVASDGALLRNRGPDEGQFGQLVQLHRTEGALTMGKKDPRIDAYIAKSADFAKPILTRLRKLVHEGCPDVVETIKWGSPSFEYHGILCGMAAFKQHCAFGFWNRALKIPNADPGAAMGQFGRLESMADMLSDK